MRWRWTVPVLALTTALAGCGVRPTGVLDAGEPAGGLGRGMRLYFASDDGLQPVPRPDVRLTSLDGALKLLIGGPSASEREAGLTNLVDWLATIDARAAAPDRVTVHLTDGEGPVEPDLSVGQLVCTLARAQSLLRGSRPDRVRVTLVHTSGRSLGPYRCPQFLTR
ncbi:hypothetical protein IHE55_22810 [Streptomyces pactum]|uniref:GerMN domain-containing protein n=1 Tax=Streptomyces pactum TaxID=68249 RepID=A0ABS0NQE8_9ACTN|nr:hypothetical protein [Streptomyces pactum]MBH5337438.1 hypothetical protein [Streptomyces pactum]